MSERIVILGAGPTGLGAGYRLSQYSYNDWEIFERDDHVGGLASSYRDGHGFIWDHGGHVMFSHYEYFDSLVEQMLAGDYDEHMREAWIWLHDRFVPYPLAEQHPSSAEGCVLGMPDGRHRSPAVRDAPPELQRMDQWCIRRRV